MSDEIPGTRSELHRWVHERMHLSPAHEQALLEAMDQVFLRHERLWQQSKQEAIQAVSTGFGERMNRLRDELQARDATVSSIARYFEARRKGSWQVDSARLVGGTDLDCLRAFDAAKSDKVGDAKVWQKIGFDCLRAGFPTDGAEALKIAWEKDSSHLKDKQLGEHVSELGAFLAAGTYPGVALKKSLYVGAHEVTRDEYFDSMVRGIYFRLHEVARLLQIKDLPLAVRDYLQRYWTVDEFCIHQLMAYMKPFHATKSDAVVRALKVAAGTGAEVKTSGYSLQPMRVYRENQPPTITGYEARNSVTVTLSDLTKLGTVIDATAQAGANDVSGIAFTLRQDRPARDRVCIYEDVNYGGRSQCWSADEEARNLSGTGWNDRISSIRVFGRARLEVYRDADYRGEVLCLLYNTGDETINLPAGGKICQLIIEQIITPEAVWAEELDETARGAGGFGSTG